MILNQIGETSLTILYVNDFYMLSITSGIYFRDLNWIQEKQKNEPKQINKRKNPIHHTHFKAREGGMIFVNKENIAVNQGIHDSRDACWHAFLCI